MTPHFDFDETWFIGLFCAQKSILASLQKQDQRFLKLALCSFTWSNCRDIFEGSYLQIYPIQCCKKHIIVTTMNLSVICGVRVSKTLNLKNFLWRDIFCFFSYNVPTKNEDFWSLYNLWSFFKLYRINRKGIFIRIFHCFPK